jgi:hypothetical protein
MSLFLVLFIAAHAIGQGQLFGFYIRNFPKSPKSIRLFGDTTHWVLAAIIPSLIHIVFYSRTWSSICFCSDDGFFSTIVAFLMPETKEFLWKN